MVRIINGQIFTDINGESDDTGSSGSTNSDGSGLNSQIELFGTRVPWYFGAGAGLLCYALFGALGLFFIAIAAVAHKYYFSSKNDSYSEGRISGVCCDALTRIQMSI